MIDSKDISVVIQGHVDKNYVQSLILSIRTYLPEAQIILSSWEGTDVTGLDFDKLILNKDPGAEIFMADRYKMSINRQIVSTISGLKQADRKYCLKLRSDLELKGNDFLKYFGKYKIRDKKCKIFKERILVSNIYFRKTDTYLFHPSDWIFFGLREDLINLFDIPLAKEPQFSNYMKNNKPVIESDTVKFLFSQYTAEQYLWISCLKKNGINVDVKDYTDKLKKEMIKLSELSIVNNFCVLDYGVQLKIFNFKHPNCSSDNTLMHSDWKRMYFKLCKNVFLDKYIWRKNSD